MTIAKLSARKIVASLGDYTLEVTMQFNDGQAATASVPAGISAGKYEVHKVGVDKALGEVRQIAKDCSHKNWTQETLDAFLSSKNFGGNTTLAVSAAYFKATNQNIKTTAFPKLMLLLFEGGRHGNSNLSIQEFTIIEDSLNQAVVDFQKMRQFLEAEKTETLVGAEGGFSPKSFNNVTALSTIKKVFPDHKIALDVADTFKIGTQLNFSSLISAYNVASIEDPYTDDQWPQWSAFNKQYGQKILVVGDDLTTTNPERIQKAINLKAINAVVIKPNQIGTVSAALEAVKTAKAGGLKTVVSHRGEETDDTWIVDFALIAQADFVKLGGMDRGERVAKYNRLNRLGMS